MSPARPEGPAPPARTCRPAPASGCETTDPLAVIDIPHLCREGRHRLVATEAAEGGHRFLIERGA